MATYNPSKVGVYLLNMRQNNIICGILQVNIQVNIYKANKHTHTQVNIKVTHTCKHICR